MSRYSWLFILLALATPARSEVFDASYADRTIIERVYYQHRLGKKLPFEQASPAELIARLVQDDLRKEIALKKIYNVEITTTVVEAEVRRIEATTRAPGILAEIKHALGDDPARFASAVARPIVVERTLRTRFENDDALHVTQRSLAETVRRRLLESPETSATNVVMGFAITHVSEAVWQLSPRPVTNRHDAPSVRNQPTSNSAQSGAYSIKATAQIAEVLGGPGAVSDASVYFEDLDPELQTVLRAQLCRDGDVSAVIETATGFLVFQAREKTAASLRTTIVSIPKRSFDEWITEQIGARS